MESNQNVNFYSLLKDLLHSNLKLTGVSFRSELINDSVLKFERYCESYNIEPSYESFLYFLGFYRRYSAFSEHFSELGDLQIETQRFFSEKKLIEERGRYILLYGKTNDFYIMENATKAEVIKECKRKESYGDYGREGVTACLLSKPIYQLDFEGNLVLDKQ